MASPWLRRLSERALSPRQSRPHPKSEEMPSYTVLFAEAVHFTRSLGFRADDLNPDDHGPLLSEDGSVALPRAMRALGIHDTKKSVRQCLRWCQFLAPRLEEMLGVRTQLTIGQLWFEGKLLFDPTRGDLESLVDMSAASEAREPTDFRRYHAWLTFGSGEILDPSIYPGLASRGLVDTDQSGRIVLELADRQERFRHVPMVVGNDFALAFEKALGVPVWAGDVDDLLASCLA